MYKLSRKSKKTRSKIRVSSSGIAPKTIIFRGKQYRLVYKAFTLSGAKKEAKKWLKGGYTVKLFDIENDPAWAAVYVNPDPVKPLRIK